MLGKAGSAQGRVVILLREGDDQLSAVASRLEEGGFSVERYTDEREAKLCLRSQPPDLLIVSEADQKVLSAGWGAPAHVRTTPLLVLGGGSSPSATTPIRASQSVFASAVERILSAAEPSKKPDADEAMERLASLGLVAASVAHEISSPLASLAMDLEMMRTQVGSGPRPAQEALEGAFEAVERIRVIVNDIRELSRAEDALRVPCDVRGVLDRSVRLLRPRLSSCATIHKEYGPTPLVAARDGRLGQLFVNLLSNAADALPHWEAGRHSIRLVTGMSARGECVVDIIDSGRGIPEEDLPHIFEPFFTKGTQQGTGLGLALCHGIVTSLGGRIEVESSPSNGSRFRVILPAHDTQRMADPYAVPSARRPTRKVKALESRSVVILDSDSAFAKSLSRALSPMSDARVVTSLTLAAALSEHAPRADVLLCEAPDSAPAREVFMQRVEALRERLPHELVLMAKDPEAIRAELGSGATRGFRVIVKPVDVSQLMTLLDRERWS